MIDRSSPSSGGYSWTAKKSTVYARCLLVLITPAIMRIPEEPSYYYIYAGEMPFSTIPGLLAADEQEGDHYEYMVSAEQWSDNGVAVDIPVQKYNWESYHSVVNQVSGVSLPAKHICEELSLRYCANTWDLHDASGVASLYREVDEHGSQANGSFCYLRRDLLGQLLDRI